MERAWLILEVRFQVLDQCLSAKFKLYACALGKRRVKAWVLSSSVLGMSSWKGMAALWASSTAGVGDFLLCEQILVASRGLIYSVPNPN